MRIKIKVLRSFHYLVNITECKKPTSTQYQNLPPYNKTYIGRAEKWFIIIMTAHTFKNKRKTQIVTNCLVEAH